MPSQVHPEFRVFSGIAKVPEIFADTESRLRQISFFSVCRSDLLEEPRQ